MSDEVRVQGWHDPVMVGSAATVADHNVPGAYPATLIHMRTKLKLPLAKEARNHVPVLRHGLTFGTPYPANLPKGQSRGARSSAGLVTVTVQGERYRSLTRIAFDSIVVDKLLADQPAKLRGVAGVYQRHDFADERARALDASAAHVVGAGEGENVVKLDRVVGVGPGAPQSAP